MPIPTGFVSHIDLLDPLCYPGSGLIIEDLASPSTVWNISASGTTYNGTFGALSLTTQTIEANAQLINTGDGAITIAGWVNINQYSYGQSFACLPAVGRAVGGKQFKQLALYGSVPNAIGLGNCSNGSGFVYGLAETPINTWVFVVVKKDAGQTTSQYKTYVNGLPNEAGFAGGNVTTSIEYTGTFSYGLINGTIFGDGASTFPMTVSQYWMYNSYLSDADVLDLYNATKGRYVTPIIEYDFSDSACYPGTGNTVFNLQPASYDFPIVNGATFVGAGSSSYFTFDGVNQHIGQGFSGGPGFGTTFTATVWVQANNGNIGSIWNSGFDSPLGREPGMYINARAFSPDPGYADASFNFGIGYLDIASPQVIGDWFNLAYVADGTNVSLYVNGVLDSTGSQGGGQWAAGGFVLGAHLSSGGGVNGPFLNAKIGYYSAYDVALSSTDISNIYSSQASRFASAPVPVVEYDFQNGSYPGSGSTITDLQGGDTNLTVGNGHWVSGTPNYFDLQGDTNLFNTNPGSGFSSTTFTVNCWYNPLYTNPGTYASVWGLGKDGNPTSPILSTNSDGTLNIQWSFGYGIVSTTVTNDWHLISFVSNGSTTTLYVDGISIGSNASSSGTVASPYTIRLGSGSNSSNAPWQYAYGKIGYWSYYDVALDAGQVLDLYNATEGSYIGPPPPSSNGLGGRQFAQGFNG
jgi:hypothetical protein